MRSANVTQTVMRFTVPLFTYQELPNATQSVDPVYLGITGWGTGQKSPIGWFAIPAKTHHATPKNACKPTNRKKKQYFTVVAQLCSLL